MNGRGEALPGLFTAIKKTSSAILFTLAVCTWFECE